MMRSDSPLKEKEEYPYVGTLLPTTSADIPYVVFMAHVDCPVPLVASSQLFKRAELERDPRATKSQRVKSDNLFCEGTMVKFKQIDIEGQAVATSLDYICKRAEGVVGSKTWGPDKHTGLIVEDFVVINPVGRRVYARLYAYVECPPELSNPLLADVVFKAELHVRVDLEKCGGNPAALPRPKLTTVVLRLWVPDEEEQTTFDICPWRTISGSQRYLGDDFNPGKEPEPPASRLSDIHLLYLGHHQALYLNNPRRKVLIPQPGSLKIGRQVVGDVFWSRRHDAYIVYWFGPEGGDVSIVPAFTELNPFADQLNCTDTRFCVWIRPATAFKSKSEAWAYRGFYMAIKNEGTDELLLGHKLLIEDPLQLLIDQKLPDTGLRVSIRPNRDYGRVAKFSIAGRRENRATADLTVSNGSGFLVNRVTGSVFCRHFPQVPLHLPVPDRAQLQVGEQITFKAAYCERKRIYIIVKWERALDVESQECEYYRNGHLFFETLKKTFLDCSDRCCLGEEFGLITDRDEVILTHAKLNKIPMPKNIRVRVRENPDPSRSTFFDVHSVVQESDRLKSRMGQPEEFEHLEPLPSLVNSTARLEAIEEFHSQLLAALPDGDEGGDH